MSDKPTVLVTPGEGRASVPVYQPGEPKPVQVKKGQSMRLRRTRGVLQGLRKGDLVEVKQSKPAAASKPLPKAPVSPLKKV